MFTAPQLLQHGLKSSAALERSNTARQSLTDYRLTTLTWPIPPVLVFRKHNEPHWELHTRERLSIDVYSVPLPLSLWDICSSCPLVLLSAGQGVCVCVCVYALVEVGLAGRLVWGVLWHLPLWRGLARTLVEHHIYQWLIVTSRSPWKHNRDLWPLFSTKAAR